MFRTNIPIRAANMTFMQQQTDNWVVLSKSIVIGESVGIPTG